MHPALAVQVLDRSSNLTTRKLLDHLAQLRFFLANDLVKRDGLHPGFLQLRERLSGLDRFMLPPVAYQQHTVVRVQARHKLVHLPGGREGGFIEHIEPLLPCVRLLPLRQVHLQC